MFALIRSASLVISALCAANIFFHVRALAYFDALSRGKRAFVALVFALLNVYCMKSAFSTAWMACLHVSLALIAADAVCLLVRRFPRGAAVRRAVRRGAAFLAGLLVCAYGLINMRVVRNTEYRVETDKFAGELRIAVISDVHLGNSLNALRALSLADRARARGAELLILAGDIADEGTELSDFELFAAGLGARRFPLGMVYVFGNHDGARYGGVVTERIVEDALTDAGVTVLTDESIRVNGFLRVVGRRNAAEKDRLSAEALLANAHPADEFVLMVDHQPAQTRSCAAAGADLLVSGHTHNGQIWPINIVSKLFGINEIEYGLQEIGAMRAVVSSGASGWGCAFRTAGRSEIAFITVTGRGQKSADAPEN